MKSILITGSSQGIGKGIALHFARLNYHVYVTYHTHQELAKEVENEIVANGGNCTVIQMDVTNEESVKEGFARVAERTGTLDVLVNNAAVDEAADIEKCNFSLWQEITRTKIDGNFLCTKYALPLLKKAENANLIIIVSKMHERVDENDPAYCVGTGGVVSFMKAMALSLSKYGIRTNGVGPSEVQTNSRYWVEHGSKKMWDEIAERNPLKRMCTPQDVAYAVQSLVDDPSKFLNGNIIYVDGGEHLL